MAGGSHSQENPTDQQCEHCRRWFSDRGIKPHQSSCALADVDVVPIREKEYRRLVGAAGVDPLAADDDPAPSAPSPQADTWSDVDTDSAPERPDARADGGPTDPATVPAAPARETVPEDDQDDDQADVEDGDDLACPECGADAGATADELEEGAKYRCGECGAKLTWRADG